MPSGSYTLAQFPLDMLELPCDTWGRRGRLLKTKLIEAYGPDMACQTYVMSYRAATKGPARATHAELITGPFGRRNNSLTAFDRSA